MTPFWISSPTVYAPTPRKAASYVAAYCERTGRAPIDPAEWDFHLTFSMFRLAAILQGIARRAEEGTAASAEAVETGRKARPIVEAAWRQVQTLASASSGT